MREKCNNCAHPSKACVSFLMTLSTKEMLEWCRVWKAKLGWSNATLAEKSHVPKGTIDRVLSQAKGDDTTEVKLSTIRPIICALTGCTMEELESCADDHDATKEALLEKSKRLEEDNAALKADVARLKQEAVNQRTFLANQISLKDRYIGFLAVALAVTVMVIIVFLVIDAANPDMGFFWLQ